MKKIVAILVYVHFLGLALPHVSGCGGQADTMRSVVERDDSALVYLERADLVIPATIEDIEVGANFNLYGKTLDDKDFDWKSLRRKYVLVKFTAMCCVPCREEIPGMLEAYEKYHDKGLEIVSVYGVEGYLNDPLSNKVAELESFIKKEKLPWIIISGPLTLKAGLQDPDIAFGIQRVPTMLLVDKEGKVLATETRGARLQQELKKLFDE